MDFLACSFVVIPKSNFLTVMLVSVVPSVSSLMMWI